MTAETIIAFGLALFVIAFLIGEHAGRIAERQRRYRHRRTRRLRDRTEQRRTLRLQQRLDPYGYHR